MPVGHESSDLVLGGQREITNFHPRRDIGGCLAKRKSPTLKGSQLLLALRSQKEKVKAGWFICFSAVWAFHIPQSLA